jgi:formate hydrogenlyase transcriptional activator
MTHPISVPPDTIAHRAQPGAEVYRALFDLSQSIAGHTDLETLCNSLATSLRHVVSFNSLGLMLHDPIHNELRLHAVSTDTAHEHKEIVIPAEGNHAGAWVWREQKPLVLSPLGSEGQWREEFKRALEHGIRALVLVPLSNGDRRIGILGFGLSEPFQPEDEALRFLQRVATEVAVSVDGYLTRQALTHERDRIRVLFDITNALVSKLPMDELFSAVSEQLSPVVTHDFRGSRYSTKRPAEST